MNKDDEDNKPNAVYKLSDDLIAVIRELVQLSLLTGTNIVDHLRAVQAEVDLENNKLIPTEDYIEAYNTMVEDLTRKAVQAQKEMDQKLIEEEERKAPGATSREFGVHSKLEAYLTDEESIKNIK